VLYSITYTPHTILKCAEDYFTTEGAGAVLQPCWLACDSFVTSSPISLAHDALVKFERGYRVPTKEKPEVSSASGFFFGVLLWPAIPGSGQAFGPEDSQK